MTNQIQSMNCPNCGAPLEVNDPRAGEIQCSHCHSMIDLSGFKQSIPGNSRVSFPGMSSLYTSDGKYAQDTIWVIASLVLGSVSLIGIAFPTLCVSFNVAGLIAAWFGRHTPRKNLVLTAVAINGIGLILNIGIIVFIIAYNRSTGQ